MLFSSHPAFFKLPTTGFKVVAAHYLPFPPLPHRFPRQSPASSSSSSFSPMLTSIFSSPPTVAYSGSVSSIFLRRSFFAFVFLGVVVALCLYASILHLFSAGFASSSSAVLVLPQSDDDSFTAMDKGYSLQKVLDDAATDDDTVIITTLNEAWSAPDSIFDLFLESFRIGYHTRTLLNHLVVVALDQKAFTRCLAVHRHCFPLVTEGSDFSKEAYFMTPDYLKMMWRRIDFLRDVLELGYNFVFTDADIMWFRNPFPRFYEDVDFQIACDHFSGNSSDLHNRPNGGFNYVRSNSRSVAFYSFWYASQYNYSGYHDQDVLNFIKRDPRIEEIGLTIRFLDTTYFGGLCEPSEDFNLVCTMHVNCCYGMDCKVNDLKIMLQDWREYMSLPPSLKRSSAHSWGVPKNCSLMSQRHTSLSLEDQKQDQN